MKATQPPVSRDSHFALWGLQWVRWNHTRRTRRLRGQEAERQDAFEVGEQHLDAFFSDAVRSPRREICNYGNCSGANLVMFGQTLRMVPQHLEYPAIRAPPAAALADHALQLGAKCL